MPNFLTKAAKRIDAVAEPGEEGIAALFVRPLAGDEAKVLGAPGGALSRMGRLADGGKELDGAPFERNCILVLTPHRLLAFGHGTLTGRVRGLVGAMDLDEISAIRLDEREDGPDNLVIDFTDGESVRLSPGTRRSVFVDAFEGLRTQA